MAPPIPKPQLWVEVNSQHQNPVPLSRHKETLAPIEESECYDHRSLTL